MNYRTNPIEVTTIGEARGLRAELVCRLSTQDFTYRIVDVATGGVLEADTGFECWSRVRAASSRILLRADPHRGSIPRMANTHSMGDRNMEKEEAFRMTLSLGKSQLAAVDTIVVVLARRQGECDRSKAIRYILAEGLDAIRGSLKLPLTQEERDVLACKEKEKA